MSEWTKLDPLPAKSNPCLCCPPIGTRFHPESIIAVGFGDAHVERDGIIVWSELDVCQGCGGSGENDAGWGVMRCPDCDGKKAGMDYWTGADAEKAAAADPDHDWRIVKFSPLHGETYQRHGPNEWMLVEVNEGFA